MKFGRIQDLKTLTLYATIPPKFSATNISLQLHVSEGFPLSWRPCRPDAPRGRWVAW